MTIEMTLRQQVKDLIEMERRSCSMDLITPLYIARMLNVPLEEVEAVMKDIRIRTFPNQS